MSDTQEGTGLVQIRPIELADITEGRVVARCWPEAPEVLERLTNTQGILGMGAWDGDTHIGVLQGYRVPLTDTGNPLWPAWNDWWTPRRQVLVEALRTRGLRGPIWCLACCHVGRTLARANENAGGIRAGIDTRYLGQGIGSMLLHATVLWAQQNHYGAILGIGAPNDLFEYALWTGHLPWTTYDKQGFEPLDPPTADADLPPWALGDAPPEVLDQARRALAEGRPPKAFHDRTMGLDLHRATEHPLVDPHQRT